MWGEVADGMMRSSLRSLNCGQLEKLEIEKYRGYTLPRYAYGIHSKVTGLHGHQTARACKQFVTFLPTLILYHYAVKY